VVSQTEFARRSNRLAKCTCTMDPIADRVELGFLEISRDRRRPGNSQPARGFLATCKSRSNYTAFDRSFVRERAPEFLGDGKEQRRQFLKASETKRRLLPLVGYVKACGLRNKSSLPLSTSS